jgi:hypothetical protein
LQNGTTRWRDKEGKNLSNWRHSISLKLFYNTSCRCNVQCNKFSRIKS